MRPNVALTQGITRLSQAGLPSPEADARTLLAHALDVAPVSLAFITDVPDAAATLFDQLLQLRAAGHPVQHLTGIAYFRGVTLQVGPGVFIPRPETEGLVQVALDWIAAQTWDRPVVCGDLGTGSGAIPKALVSELAAADTPAQVYAVELSEAAYSYAAANLAGSGVTLQHGDFATAFPDQNATFDVVLSNPPYIPTGSRGSLPLDVAGRDPDLALFAGVDGLDALAVVANTATRLLRPGGLLLLEHDETQAETLPELLRATGAFGDIENHPDLTGRPRYVSARRQPVVEEQPVR
ncbi:MAG: peptide chain release factor N(5)-glutamine methyltransferase [Propionibacteriaceae bacterium]|jgi:release factor glutamine methyltransferase|nr:peptide chain release factor N(5)-glutamine methyltransferase [Propionibacteriaceae bacterium]